MIKSIVTQEYRLLSFMRKTNIQIVPIIVTILREAIGKEC